MFKNLLGKAKEKLDNVDLKSVEEYTKTAKKTVQDEMKKHGVDKVVDKVKKEASIVSQAVSAAAEEVYEENKETLEKPVSKVSGVVDKISEHSEELKWAGGIIAAIAMPVTTAVAGAAIFLLSEDDENLTDEEKTEKEKVKEVLDGKTVLSTKTSMVELVYNKETKEVYGKILIGKQKDRSFEEVGLDNMKELSNQLDPENQEHKETLNLISGWIKWKEKKTDEQNKK